MGFIVSTKCNRYLAFQDFIKIVVGLLALLTLGSYAQTGKQEKSFPPPHIESFEPVLDLITVNSRSNNYGIYGDILRLYDENGEIWCQYSLLETSPLYFAKQNTKSLKPFFEGKYSFFKLVAISKSWYKVEINSESKETKYMLVTDPFIKRDDIKLRLRLSPFIKFDEDKNPLRDEPDGGFLTYAKESDYFFRAAGGIEGNWLQVELVYPERKSDVRTIGWVQWRNGNNLLIQIAYR